MKRLNAYKVSEKFVKEGIEFLKKGKIPERYHYPSRILEFTNRYHGMRAQEDGLYVNDLKVVPRENINTTLAQIYAKVGDIGRDRLYAAVKRQFAGISRPQVQAFLNNQELHQLVQQVKKHKVNKAIVMSKPMERWQADLVDTSKYKSPQNSNTTFLLTVIDCFSKFAWVVPLKNKEAASVAKAMERIFDDAGGAPATIQTDNGREFEDEFARLLSRQGIERATSRSYNPQANGQIERFNGTLKRMIQAHMMKNDTKTYVPQLAMMVTTYNELLHTGIRQRPIDAHNNPAVAGAVAKQLQSRAIKNKARGRHTKRPLLKAGDTVRVALVHQPLEKPVTFWTKELFQVMNVIPPANAWDAAMYVLHDGRKFTRDRLQKVDPERLVRVVEKQKRPTRKTPAAPKTKPAVESRTLPQRERAPSSKLMHHYVDL